MLFDKVLSQTFRTDTWQATAAISADYLAEVIFLFLAFGMPSNRTDTVSLTLVDIITSVEEREAPMSILKKVMQLSLFHTQNGALRFL